MPDVRETTPFFVTFLYPLMFKVNLLVNFFMPPTSKKLEGHVASGSSALRFSYPATQ